MIGKILSHVEGKGRSWKSVTRHLVACKPPPVDCLASVLLIKYLVHRFTYCSGVADTDHYSVKFAAHLLRVVVAMQ